MPVPYPTAVQEGLGTVISKLTRGKEMPLSGMMSLPDPSLTLWGGPVKQSPCSKLVLYCGHLLGYTGSPGGLRSGRLPSWVSAFRQL